MSCSCGHETGKESSAQSAGRNSWRRNFPLLLLVANRRILRQLAREFRQTVVGAAQLDLTIVAISEFLVFLDQIDQQYGGPEILLFEATFSYTPPSV